MRDLSDLTYNSAVGLGMADVVTDRLVERTNWEPTYINSLTANTPAAMRTPIHFATDRECIERFAPTVGKLDLAEVTYGWIRNTMELGASRSARICGRRSRGIRCWRSKLPLISISTAEEI